ncbi:MAG: hypothetical protein JNG83_11965 [Opitutaceae bacterium]|nr:hypothetical protein [Opitutaceae bacterium]
MHLPTPCNRRDFVKSALTGAVALGALRGLAAAGAAAPGGPTANPVPAEGVRGIVLSDLGRCEPASALTREFADNRWQLVEYETVEGVKGAMVYARPEHTCGVLTLPLGAQGPHRIHLGYHVTNSHYPGPSAHGQLDVRLTRDAGFRRVCQETGGAEGQDLFKSVQEVYWKTADLTGQSLHFRQPQAPYRWPREASLANLAYVRIVPLTPDEVRDWEASRPTPTSRRLALIYCSAQLSGSTDGTENFHPTSEQWFADDFEAYRDTDIGVFIFEALRGNYCLYRSQIGDVGSEDNRWRDEWVDPLAAFARQARASGMKYLAAMRMIGPQYPMIRAPIGRARHYWRHQEWSKRDREGRVVGNLSLAYEGTRRYWLSLLREILEYDVDGIHLHLNRSTPFVLYEEPVVRAFVAQHGVDPRTLPDHDPRWLAHGAGYLTQFVREVRALVDRKPGRQLGVTVFGPTKERPTDERYKLKSYVCDVDAWLGEGLVNYVIPSQQIDPEVLRRWRRLAGDRAHIWPDLMPRSQPPAAFARQARGYHEAGADGFSLWDGERRHARLSEWAALRQLGHLDRLDPIARQGPSWFRSVRLATLGGLSAQDSFRDG